jgi:hypothetical protein
MMLLVFVGITLAQQAQHDTVERRISSQVQRQKEAIMDLWPHIDRRVSADFDKAQKCYASFHLWKAKDCETPLSKVDHDLSIQNDKQQIGQ